MRILTKEEITEAIKYFESMAVKYPDNSAMKDELEEYEEKFKIITKIYKE